LDLFTLRHSVCSFFCFGSLAVDPVGGALNYVIALLLPPIPIGRGIEQLPAWLAWGVPLVHKPPLNTPVLMLKPKLAEHNKSVDINWSLMHS
jgi:hypothetical protein